MTDEQALVKVERKVVTLEEVKYTAECVMAGGIAIPDGVRNKEAALTIMLTGRELGVPPMLSLREIHIIKGQACLAASLMCGLVHRDHAGRFDFDEGKGRCTVKGTRTDTDPFQVFETTWTMDRVPADLKSKKNWKDYQPQMLRARAISEVCNALFPDIIGGMYAPEDFGERAPRTIQVHAEVIEAPTVEDVVAVPVDVEEVQPEPEPAPEPEPPKPKAKRKPKPAEPEPETSKEDAQRKVQMLNAFSTLDGVEIDEAALEAAYGPLATRGTAQLDFMRKVFKALSGAGREQRAVLWGNYVQSAKRAQAGGTSPFGEEA